MTRRRTVSFRLDITLEASIIPPATRYLEEIMTGIRQGEGRFAPPLTPRERFNRTMHYQHVDYISHLEFGYWAELKEEWMRQGHLPRSFLQPDGTIPDRFVEEYFGVAQFESFTSSQNWTSDHLIGAHPPRPFEVIEETDHTITYRDEVGIIRQEQTAGTRTIPHFLEFPIRNRVTWQAFRDEFLDPNHPDRALPEEALRDGAEMSRTSTNPVLVNFGSFIGWVRNWVGFENLAYMSMDNPDLIEEMVAHLADMLLVLLPQLLVRGPFDAAAGWEDICFNSGPLLNPRLFAEHIMPHMRPVMRMLRQHGIDVIWTDCDGNILALIPLWLDVGLNCMFPLEVNPGNDPVELKREYGRDLLIRGGFNKFVLHQGREAIFQELLRLEPAVAEGGFIPHVDHRCPGEVSFDTYCYYIWEKCHMLGWPEEVIASFPALRDWRP